MQAHKMGFNPEYSEQAPTLDEIEQLDEEVLLEFGAPWCGHCQAAAPAIEDVLGKRSLSHIKVFDGKGKKLGRQFKVTLWPTLILLRNGEEVGRVVRPLEAQQVARLLDSE